MTRWNLVALSLMLGLAATALAQEGAPEQELGLSQESVFETPDPIVAEPVGEEPGANGDSQGYFAGMPPTIPHLIEEFLPIKASENLCLDCHQLREEIGKEVAPGDPVPMPASHYRDLRAAPEKMAEEVEQARWVCVQCHVTQTDAAPLVPSTYEP